ncbi:MAG: class I SAM-dependent RNA methyltransferase [Treponema sp.]|nr:class I SAM-dependent RNA methyltransferase [Treponema sp.]
MIKSITAVALCAVGAEKAVSNEIKKFIPVKISHPGEESFFKIDDSLYGRVRFKTNIAGLYQALIGLRAADRVLLEAAVFNAKDFDDLFDGASAVAWEELIPKGMGLKVAKVRSNRSLLKAETSIQAIVHKAAAQRLCEKYKMSRLPEPVIIPRTKKENQGGSSDIKPVKVAEVRVYIEKDIVSLLVDLSGEPLFKRGYRSEGGAAPLRETTAASILLLSGWKRKFPLYDPFCGSGTILIEAIMYAWDMSPGLGRRFALEDLLIADSKTGQAARESLRSKIDFNRVIRIAGSDEDMRSVSIASSNIARLYDIAEGREPQRGIRAVDRDKSGINLKVIPMKDASFPFAAFSGSEDNGYIITNPPYGKRLGDQSQAENIYKEMSGLDSRFSGWKLAVITDHSGFESFYGRKADSCREISNGAIPSYLFQYELI